MKSSADQLLELITLALSAFTTALIGGGLLMWCASFATPSFVLAYWQWCVIATTIRILFAPGSSK
jgi:hypothetical protein